MAAMSEAVVRLNQDLLNKGASVQIDATLAVRAKGGTNAGSSQELPTASYLRREFWHTFCGEIENEF